MITVRDVIADLAVRIESYLPPHAQASWREYSLVVNQVAEAAELRAAEVEYLREQLAALQRREDVLHRSGPSVN